MDREAPGFGITADPDVLLADVKKRFRAMAEAELRLMPHARRALEEASRRFITALVTNAPRQDTEMIVSRLGLGELLRHLVTREEYASPKPSPDCYVAAARIVGASPPECLAIEDSSRGVRAALGAGVPCVAVLNEMTRYEPPQGALMTLQSLAELDFDAPQLVSAFG